MVADQTDLAPSLRRLANRKAVPRRPPTDRSQLTRAAYFGNLTSGNTKPGTRGRQAVDALRYRNRRMARPELPAREALGIRGPTTHPRVATFLAEDPPRIVSVEGVSGRDMIRAGTYMQAAAQLAYGRRGGQWTEAARSFERRFRSWKPIAGLTLVSDPEVVLALLEVIRAGEIEIIFDSGRSRPGRRRRIR